VTNLLVEVELYVTMKLSTYSFSIITIDE